MNHGKKTTLIKIVIYKFLSFLINNFNNDLFPGIVGLIRIRLLIGILIRSGSSDIVVIIIIVVGVKRYIGVVRHAVKVSGIAGIVVLWRTLWSVVWRSRIVATIGILWRTVVRAWSIVGSRHLVVNDAVFRSPLIPLGPRLELRTPSRLVHGSAQ